MDAQDKKRTPKFTIGRDTTYVDGPKDKDGYVDYVTALNERLREGVTPENNAVVALMQVYGPTVDGEPMPAKFFEWLQIPAPPEKGNYFVNLFPFLRSRFKIDDYEELAKISDALGQLTARPWKAKEHPKIADWLTANEKPMAVAIEATRRSRYYYPLVPMKPAKKDPLAFEGLIVANFAGAHQQRHVASALLARAMLRRGEGRYEDAWQDLLACLRLGRKAGSGASLIEGLLGFSLEQQADDACLAFLDGARLDSARLQKCLHDLQALPPRSSMGDKVQLFERFMFLDAVMFIDRSGGAGLDPKLDKRNFALFDWDPTLRKANQHYSRMAVAMRLKDRTLREKHLQDIDFDHKDLVVSIHGSANTVQGFLATLDVRLGITNKVGDILIALLTPGVRKVQHAVDRTEQTTTNVHIAFALAAYRAAEGRYPKDLAALAPKYIADVPLDLFSGKSLIYQPRGDGYLLYSVGANQKDDEGRTEGDDPRGDDLPVRMPLPKK